MFFFLSFSSPVFASLSLLPPSPVEKCSEGLRACNRSSLSLFFSGADVLLIVTRLHHCLLYPFFFLVPTPNCYVTTSVGLHADEMPSRQATPHPRSLSYKSANVTPTAIDTSPSACWDWLLFPPTSYPELYTCVYQPQSSRPDDDDSQLYASLPTCLLALLYLTPNLSDASDDENESDQEISTLHPIDEPLSKTGNISSSSLLSSSAQTPTESKRSSTPDTDDGYQSASDASRSDYSQSSSGGGQRAGGSDPAHVHEPPSVVPRISYAAAVKPLVAPLTTSINKSSSSITTTTSKGKQTMNNSLSTSVNGASDNYTNNNSQKIKFIAPRFERIHHAKQQHPSGSSAARSIHAGRRR